MLVAANIFQPLIDVFEAVLKIFHGIGVSWGFSIVLLTVLIRALLLPLAVKQFHSMQRLQTHMPELKALQAKYKDDKQRQQQEVMKFYQENKVNPFGSCAPLAAQLPVFISLFYMLRTTLRHDICPKLNAAHAAHTVPCGPTGHAGFLFIHDLTNSASGATLVVLIVLYVGTQLASSLLMTNSATMDKNQRYLMLAMPVFFVIFVIRFPAGVLVYWITTNAWTMAQQYIIKRRLGPVPPAGGVAVATAGAPSGAGSPNGRNGSGSGPDAGKPAAPPSFGGLADRLRGRGSRGSDADVGASTATAERSSDTRTAPPPPPRKKKKQRSGRRR